MCLSSGLDIDWEYPTQRGGKPQDKETFVLLVKELSQEFRKFNLHLSSAFGAAKKTIDSAYSVHNIARIYLLSLFTARILSFTIISLPGYHAYHVL